MFCIQGACIFVAVMLQYFFTSAFCWMLCEGVILYLMLVVVFSSRFNNRLFFFALGWGMNTKIAFICVMVGVLQVLQYQQLLFLLEQHTISMVLTSKLLLISKNSITQYFIYSCWISTENGAIAAFIVPMVVIILVCLFILTE